MVTNMTQIPTPTHAEARLSGRELARQRRKAMATMGKRAVKPAGRQKAAAAAPAPSASSAQRPVRQPEQGAARHQGGCGCGCKGEDARRTSAGSNTPSPGNKLRGSGRDIARARRKALSTEGKAAVQPAAHARHPSGQGGRVVRSEGLSGRQVAMQRRKMQSLNGRGDAGAPQPARSGSRHPAGQRGARTPSAQPEAEAGRKLAGHGITGTKVERASQVTGNQAGSTRAVTGTPYLPAAQARGEGSARPPATAGTDGAAQTSKGKTLTGTLVSSQGRVTGGEAGAGRNITGTRYARADASRTAPSKVAVSQTANGSQVTGMTSGHSARISGTESRAVSGSGHPGSAQQAQARKPAAPRKVSVMSAPEPHAVTGTSVGRDKKVTGNETGSSRAISGTPYFNNQDFGDASAVEAPAKVGAAFTRSGTRVSGTEVSANPKVTGEEEGRCSLVTGTDYVGARDMQATCTTSTPPDHAVSKVAVDQTWQGEAVTGSGIGRSVKMTGDEPGSCAAVSGTPYIGQAQYAQFCEGPQAEEQLAHTPSRGIVSAADITGDRPGAGGSVMTGDERGACEPVTGTPYVGADNMPDGCAVDSAASGRFVARRQQHAQAPRAPAPGDFSIASPARQAFDQRENSAVTGSSMAHSRITGSASRAEGMITGTPEFRHRDGGQPATQVAGGQAGERQRLTGEASQRSATITGDAWGAQQRVTGTEGHFSANRNPTMRGHPRGAGRSVQDYRHLERPDVPESPVTGSAGAAKRGAVVTVSGGARG